MKATAKKEEKEWESTKKKKKTNHFDQTGNGGAVRQVVNLLGVM
jgi:hypothetical protein